MTALIALPDIAAQSTQRIQPLDWVGMQAIALPLWLQGQRIAASASAGVSLDDGSARSIHMSRLYLALQSLERETLNPGLLRRVLQEFLLSHQGLSQQAYLDLRGEVSGESRPLHCYLNVPP